MFTISKLMNYVNAALNYPTATFDDIKLFLDQSISEINTELHTSIISIDEMTENKMNEFNNLNNLISLTDYEIQNELPVSKTVPSPKVKYYYDSTHHQFGVLDNNEYTYYDELYAICPNLPDNIYKAVANNAIGYWANAALMSPKELDLEEYLPNSWITLFVIPYICYKYSVRDGDTGRLFSEEFAQGFAQCRKSYNVPKDVDLISVIGIPAYKQDLTKNLENLKAGKSVRVPTRAITEAMKNAYVEEAHYSDGFYNGGFRI